MLEFMGDVGGLFEIIYLAVAGVITFIVHRDFKAAIISDTYQVQKYTRDQSEFYKSKKNQENGTKHIITSESVSDESSESSNSH